jgi:hypothetical protein
MKIKAMYSFAGFHDFLKFSEFLESQNWKIEKQLLKERVEKYYSYEAVKMLKTQFNTQKLTIWDLKEEEIITWLDTMTIIRRVFMNLFKKGINDSKIRLIMEYPLVNGNHMRTDYLLIYDRLIIVVEFGMFNQDEKRSEERYTKKLQESINYRQIIANQVSTDVKVINYVMIYRPEYDRYTAKNLEENIIYNQYELSNLVNYLFINIIKEEGLSAIKQLEAIELSKI